MLGGATQATREPRTPEILSTDLPDKMCNCYGATNYFLIGSEADPQDGIHVCYCTFGQKPMVGIVTIGQRGNLLLLFY